MFILEASSPCVGVVEVVTEWLPHQLDRASHLTGSNPLACTCPPNLWICLCSPVGHCLAVLLLFFTSSTPSLPGKIVQRTQTWTLWGKVVLACIPSAVIGLPLNDWMSHLMTPWVVAARLHNHCYGVGFLVI